jgi:hypothetical protein
VVSHRPQIHSHRRHQQTFLQEAADAMQTGRPIFFRKPAQPGFAANDAGSPTTVIAA